MDTFWVKMHSAVFVAYETPILHKCCNFIYINMSNYTYISTPICAVLKLSSRANLPSLVNLALSVNYALNDNVIHKESMSYFRSWNGSARTCGVSTEWLNTTPSLPREKKRKPESDKLYSWIKKNKKKNNTHLCTTSQLPHRLLKWWKNFNFVFHVVYFLFQINADSHFK